MDRIIQLIPLQYLAEAVPHIHAQTSRASLHVGARHEIQEILRRRRKLGQIRR